MDVLVGKAARYRGALADATGAPDATRRVAFDGTWLAPVPGTELRCDARIVPDVNYVLDNFGLRLTACFAASGHATGGEHPLGLATDLVPIDGDWHRAMAAARFFGWTEDCAASGCADRVRPPMRVVLYNGYPSHGDPAHCAAPACPPHLHLSWSHAATAPLTPAPWVDVLTSR